MRRERYFHRTQARVGEGQPLRKAKSSIEETLPTLPFHVDGEETLPPTSPDQHHHISLDTRSKVILPVWLNQNEGDPALLVRASPVLIQVIQFSDRQLTGFSTTTEEPSVGSFIKTGVRWR